MGTVEKKSLKMALRVLISIFALGLALNAVEGRPGFGKCKDFPVMTGFEPQKYLGRWYEYSKYFAIFELFGTCTNAIYSDATTKEGDLVIGVHNMGINSVTGNLNEAIGTAVLADPSDPTKAANLIVNFDSNPVKSNTTNYSVVKTDYEKYAVVYSCSNGPIPGTDIEFFWILTREQFPNEDMIKEIYAEAEKQGFNTSHLKKTKQSVDCPRFPDH